ncbi:hypothetical protein SERLA73DRAFT_81710, partial [Serpula lacrymans var. lacrymans S7.3]
KIEKPDNRLNSLAGRSYDEIRAFFYDQQVKQNRKATGKRIRGLGHLGTLAPGKK